MTSSLTLVTYEYPFGKSETFLETEINYLAEAYDEVWIIPSRAAWSKSWMKSQSDVNRNIPDNCQVFFPSVSNLQNRIRLVQYFFKALVRIDFITWVRILRISYYLQSLREALKSALFVSRTKEFFQNQSYDNLVYSYWKMEATVGLGILKHENVISKYVSRAHGGDLYYEGLKYNRKPFEKYLIQSCDYIIPISRHGFDYLLKLGYSVSKIRLSRLGIERPSSLSRPSNDSIIRFVSCSNLIRVKRVDLLAEALSLLDFNFIWTHFGEGPERELVGKHISRFPITGKADLRGRVPNKIINEHYMNNPVDLFINVSTSEGLPVSIMEALISGIPCIATDVGGTSDIVNNKCGILVDRNITPEQLAKTITSQVLDNKSLIEKRTIAAEIANTHVDANVNYTNFTKLLKRF
jgi:glycosyltransferase involved in cell wall biosynthesis